jgi:DNA replication protein DnaC
MLLEQTLAALQKMKLHGMARSLQDRLTNPAHADLSHADFVSLLVQDETTDRENRRLARLLKNAHFREKGSLEDVDYAKPRGLPKQAFLELSSPAWITTGRSVLFTGPAGVGKTWLSCALGNYAARQGFTVESIRAPRLFATLHQSRGNGSHLRALARIAKIQVFIIDDLFLTVLTDEQRADLLEIVEDRYNRLATIVTSQLHTNDWHQAVGDPTIADALIDRLFQKAFKFNLKGPSLR